MGMDEIIAELEKQTNLSRKELMERIDKKCMDMDDLVTEEGAAYLVARELGLNLASNRRQLEIKNIIPEMRNLNVIGRVLRISSIKDFERHDGSKGRVVNLTLADSTGSIRIPLWDDQVKLVEESIKIGDIIQVTNGLSQENVFGNIEISLGRFGSIRQVDDSFELPSLEELTKKFFSLTIERTSIKDIVPGNFEIRSTITDVFRGKFIFNTCTVCGSTFIDNKCPEHGDVEASANVVISCIVDDGTDSLRVVFFRELAEKLSRVSSSELITKEPDTRYELIKEKLLGRDIILSGRVKKNVAFDRIEMIADDFKDLNPLEESKRLVEDIELAIGE